MLLRSHKSGFLLILVFCCFENVSFSGEKKRERISFSFVCNVISSARKMLIIFLCMRNLYIKGSQTFADRSLSLSLHTRENEFKDLQNEFKSQIEELNKEQQKKLVLLRIHSTSRL